MTREGDDADAASDAARRLLEREAPPDYLASWGKRLAPSLTHRAAATRDPVAVVRIGEERFALSTACVREVHRPRRVIVVPGRTNEILRGLVCLRGEILLCASFHALVAASTPLADDQPRARMVVIEREGARWAFSVDEVVDIRTVDRAAAKPAQVTVAKAAVHLSDALLELNDGAAARIDPDRLFSALARCLT